MGTKRSGKEEYSVLEIYLKVFVGFVLIYSATISYGVTNPSDVAAINSLYSSLGSPILPGWVASGGDPCGELWQGVACEASDITSIDLSSNRIGGSIPSNLPVTMQNFFLAANNFTGSIPDSISSLTLLTAMSLNNNFLSGEIPDSFQFLAGLINLDLSSNNFSGQLPPSFENLIHLTTLRLQENQLSGTLNVLEDLPLKDLNIENNLFSGPIPEKLLAIPDFRKDGNPFNNSTAPLPAPTSPLTPPPAPGLSGAPSSPSSPSSGKTPGKQIDGPSSPEESSSGEKKFLTTKRVVWISIAGVLLFVILAIALVLFMPRCSRRREEAGRIFKRHQVGADKGNRENPRDHGSLDQPTNETEKVSKEALALPKEDHPKPQTVIVTPTVPTEASTAKPPIKAQNPLTSARSFTIASLQQYTNSFSQENLIGGGMLGNVYRAELPNGKLLAVKKLDQKASSQQKDDEFIELVNNIDRIRHANVVELMGYCAEHGQRLLIYEYCSNGTLQDALHSDDELKKKLSWNTRIRMALGAARALEYLHEVCQPPVVHRNFKSVNILLDDDLDVRVSDCGLAPLISSGSVSQLSGHLLTAYGYGAPEFESGIYTVHSDVFSFGVVMLELLTGRTSYDRTRTRNEQFLVRWAIPQLHDIDALSKMVDPSLNGEYPAKSLSHFADIISRCVQNQPEFRPPMSEVVQDLTDMIRRERPSRESIGE
ncbi:lrr receptor-linked protein kinase, putative [Ricinus communis]|uniref:Lrr receptor-linked protein kinase, putative n=1 Tax=Ricinus communis TaxID=3988 RepID=B9RW50_RICCO|nr:lrr receptor-linked protein kinase, putative [Ricinus communis]